jgi:homocysteine S-methyltransferase
MNPALPESEWKGWMNLKIFKPSNRIFILDGAMGTELERRGFNTGLPLWSAQALLEAPELVLQIHKEYIEAGADIITTNTFRTNPYTITKAGLLKSDRDMPQALTKIACNLAKQAKGDKKVVIGGSVAPIEDCFSPQLYPGEEIAQKDHYAHIKNLKQSGVDFILAETMLSIKEVLIVLSQAKRLKIDCMVSFALQENGNILNGDNLIEALNTVSEYNPLAFLINCTTLDIIEKVIDSLLANAKIPIGVYPNFGPPVKGKFAKYLTPEKFAEALFRLGKKGVKILGGCCGTQPQHIKALANRVKPRPILGK